MNGQAIIDDMSGVLAPTFANDNTAALQALVATGAAELILTPGIWICTQTLSLAPGQHLRGLGGGYNYDHQTKLVFKGTGAKSWNIPGAANPTTIANPAAGNGYLGDSETRGNNYRFLDLSTEFSVGVRLNVGSRLSDLGIYPLVNGSLEAYKSESPWNNHLSDDWGVGVWADNADGWVMERVQVQGHWRQSAFLASNRDNKSGQIGTPSCEGGHAEACRFYGFRGVTVRTPNNDIASWGFAGTDFVNCQIRSLLHRNGKLATSSGLATPFTHPSACLEMHGSDNSVRGVQFLNCTFMGRDDIAAILDRAAEILFSGCYWESKEVAVTGVTDPYGVGFRMVTTEHSSIRIVGGTRYGMSTMPAVPNDPGLNLDGTPPRYSDPSRGVNNAKYYCDDEYYLPPTNPQQFRGDIVMPQVTTAQLTDKLHAINAKGKFFGRFVFNTTTGVIYRANASSATGTWKDVMNTSTITPV